MRTYEDLPFSPFAIACVVASRPYTGEELSPGSQSSDHIRKLEQRRQRLTDKQVCDFTQRCDERCRAAYKAKAEWFMKLVRAKGNNGRDQLYVWTAHWLAAFLLK
jgi:hypothetical protein